MRMAAPVQYLSSLIAREVSNLWGNFVYLVEVKADHQRLAYENARLSDRVRRLEQNEIELRRVKRLLGLRESVQGDPISAQVIGKDLTEFFRVASVVVDRAGREVRPNMPVIALDGVVGKVQRVSGERVDVLLAVDSGSGIPVARVTKVVKRDFGMYQVVEAVPTVDFSRLEEVLIITSPPGDEPAFPRPNR